MKGYFQLGNFKCSRCSGYPFKNAFSKKETVVRLRLSENIFKDKPIDTLTENTEVLAWIAFQQLSLKKKNKNDIKLIFSNYVKNNM